MPYGSILTDSLGGMVAEVSPGQYVHINGSTVKQDWQYEDGSSYSYTASHPNGTLFLAGSGAPQVVALDGNTGQPKFTVGLPSSFSAIHFNHGSSFDQVGPYFTFTGPLTVMPDGTTVLEAVAVHDTENWVCDSVDGVTWSVSAQLYLVTIQPNGAKTIQTLDSTTVNGSTSFCDVTSGVQYQPGEIIPDGQGGMVASWGKTTSGQQYILAHISGGTTATFEVPYVPSFSMNASQSASDAGSGQYMILGDNGTVFTATLGGQSGSGYNSIVYSYNIQNGATNWTYQIPNTTAVQIIAATDGGGVVVKTTSNGVDSIVDLDANGNATPEPLTGTSLSYAGGYTWLDPPSGGTLTSLLGNIEQWASSSIWPGPGTYSRVPDPQINLQVAAVQGVDFSLRDNGTLESAVSGAISYWAMFGRIHLLWDGTIDPVPASVANNHTCQDTYGGYSSIDITDVSNDGDLCEVRRRFLQPKGSQILFTSLVNSDAENGFTYPVSTVATPRQYLNLSIFGWKTGAQTVAHELGHQFQLQHENPFNPLNVLGSFDLMCGGTSTIPYVGPLINLAETVPCTGYTSLFLTPRQIIDARKGAQRWVSSN